MGGTVTAGAEGADALLSNPAGLASLGPGSPSDLSVSYNSLLETSYLGTVSYGRPLGAGTLGADLVYFSQGEMTAYSATGDSVGSLRPYDLALAVAYARRLERVSLGGGLKLIRSSVDDVSGTSFALDFGVQAKNVYLLGGSPLDVGASLSNLGPPIKVGGLSAPLPFALAGGLLWHVAPALDACLDGHLPSDQDPYVSLGFEAGQAFDQKKRKAFLRLGYDQGRGRDVDGLAGLTAGGGLDLGNFRLDYAWVSFGDLGMQNRFTLAFRF